MEIERKFLIEKENLPENLASYPCHRIEQGYLCTSPVVRIRRQDDDYFLTYKSKGLMSREEYNLPLTAEAYEHLKPKADGILITKDRYVIPEKDGLFIELDVFHGKYEGVLLAEVLRLLPGPPSGGDGCRQQQLILLCLQTLCLVRIG